MVPCTPGTLRITISRCSRWFSVGHGGREFQCDAPRDIGQVVLDLCSFDPLPRLVRAVTAPFYDRAWELVRDEGYNASSETYLEPAPMLRAFNVPVPPSETEVAVARSLLMDELLGDFAFSDGASKANALALALTPLVMDAIDDCTPMFVVDSPHRGSGKSTLARAMLSITQGHMPEDPAPDTASDFHKKLEAILLSAPSAVLIDNIVIKVEGSTLSAALTSRRARLRRYHRNDELVEYDVRAAWVVTGNRVRIHSDLVRRTVPLRLKPPNEAWTREQGLHGRWRHEHIVRWVLDNRADLLRSLCILVENWKAKGQLPSDHSYPSYDRWARNIGGILRAAGIDGFLDNIDDWRDVVDDDTNDWQSFLLGLATRFDAPVSTSDSTVGLPRPRALRVPSRVHWRPDPPELWQEARSQAA